MGLDTTIIEQLAERLDPKQTMLYIPSWRAAGYDRDYPSYDAFVDGLLPFMDRAHELGYRVMLHVNYFGVDPLNPLYEQFEPYHVRSPWGTHEKEWWLWTRADPVIRFAYINPACKAWRDVFVERMVALRAATGVDALHLDQTLCIFNDHNGLIDGMSMMEGNTAIHKALREALPEVAISGEGLNEITHRYEAFAQRHAWGLHHHEGTWSRAHLACAHPISSYLLRPYTIIYGYLGCAPPQDEQVYAAWNEAYQHWGVIPTLKPRNYDRAPLSGFERQFFDEAAFWQRAQPRIDVDGEWPGDVVFPYRCASGETAYRTRDRRLVHGESTISRTVTDVTELQAPGTVPGWLLYDKDGYFGLNADTWYPYFDTPRDASTFHVAQLPEGFTIALASENETMACVRVRQSGGIVADLAAEIDRAVTGSVPFSGEPTVQTGALQAEDGGAFSSSGSMLHAHPPW
ncbi:MAG: hypothetical protein GY851_11320, partial [bacterium]|nr:hypothetical protein [bacterium]